MLNSQFDNVESSIFVYETYQSLKLHFNNLNYDFFKYRGKTKNSVKTQEQSNNFLHSKNYPLCSTISRRRQKNKHEIVEFLIANLEKNNRIWLDKLREGECDDIYLLWKKRQESLTYLFISDINIIMSEKKAFNKYFTIKNGYSDILTLLLHDKISIETVVILDWLLNFIGDDIGESSKDFVLYDIKLRIKKYKTIFLYYHGFKDSDKKKFRGIVKKKADECVNILPF